MLPLLFLVPWLPDPFPQFPSARECRRLSEETWEVKLELDRRIAFFGPAKCAELTPLMRYAEHSSWVWWHAFHLQRSPSDYLAEGHAENLISRIGGEAFDEGRMPWPLKLQRSKP